MCEPMTIVAATGALASAAAGTAGAVRSANTQAAVARRNAELARQQRTDALARGKMAAGRARSAGRDAAATATAGLAASGVDVTSGSPAGTIATSLINAEMDADMAEANAARQAWGFEAQAQNAEAQAKSYEASRVPTVLGGVFSGVTGAVSAGASAQSAFGKLG